MASILVTGFERFGSWAKNPSAIVAQMLEGEKVSNYEIQSKTLPVRYKEINEITANLIKDFSPEIVLMTGIAEGSTGIRVEKIAINEATARIPYMCGSQPIEESIVPSGPAAYFSGLPVSKIVEVLNKNGIPAYISYSAGTYGCNQAFYCLMHEIHRSSINNGKSANTNLTGGFIHLPITPDMVATAKSTSLASMSIESILRGIKLILEIAVDFHESKNNSKG